MGRKERTGFSKNRSVHTEAHNKEAADHQNTRHQQQPVVACPNCVGAQEERNPGKNRHQQQAEESSAPDDSCRGDPFPARNSSLPASRPFHLLRLSDRFVQIVRLPKYIVRIRHIQAKSCFAAHYRHKVEKESVATLHALVAQPVEQSISRDESHRPDRLKIRILPRA